MYGAWDSRSFALVARADAIDELDAAITALDVTVSVGAQGVFGGGPGFTLCIHSRISEEVRQAAYEADVEYFELRDWETASGVLDAIHASTKIERGGWGMGSKSGPAYFACSAKKWPNGKIMWWLNPYSQHKYSAGWYTSEQLLEWCEGRGPVLTPVGKP